MPDLTPEYEAAWRQFQRIRSLRLLGETIEGEWRMGRTDYVAFLVMVTHADVRRAIAGALARLADIPGVDPYPERYWHMTVKGVGFTRETALRDDELPAREVRRIADAARPVLEAQPRFEARLGRVNAFAEVVYMEVHEDATVRALNTALVERVPGLQRYPVDGPMWLPHVSIARYTSDEGLAALKQRLGEMRSEPAPDVAFEATEVELVQAHLAAEAPTFDLIEMYRLAGG